MLVPDYLTTKGLINDLTAELIFARGNLPISDLPGLIRRVEIASTSASSFIWSALHRRQNLHPTNAYCCELPSHANGVA